MGKMKSSKGMWKSNGHKWTVCWHLYRFRVWHYFFLPLFRDFIESATKKQDLRLLYEEFRISFWISSWEISWAVLANRIIWPVIRHVPFKTVILKDILDFDWMFFIHEHYSLYVETNIHFQLWANWQIQIQILLIRCS